MTDVAKNIELTEDLQAFAEERVRAGHYASVADVVRDALEEKKLTVLREALDVGIVQRDAGKVVAGTPSGHMDRFRARHGMNRNP